MEDLMKLAIEGMRHNGFDVVELRTAKDACDYLAANIPDGATVGVGGSVSVRDTGALSVLEQKGCTVYSHWGVPPEDARVILKNAMDAQVYLTSANAVTRTGKLVLVDGTGNRTAAVCYGPMQVYFVISRSKVVDGGINTAVARIKKTACPQNARRLGLKTSCALTGNCAADCSQSMCRLTLAVDRVPKARRMTVLFVEETLGY